MSRIGKKPVRVPQGVTATVDGQTVTAKGPKGELKFVVNDEVLVKMEGSEIAVQPRDQTKTARSKWGMSRTQIVNILAGRQGRLREEARDHRRRLSRRHAGQEPAAGARLQP